MATNLMVLVKEIMDSKRREEEREQANFQKRLELQFAREERALDRQQDLIIERLRDQDKAELELNRVRDKFEKYNISPEDATGSGTELFNKIDSGEEVSSSSMTLKSVNTEIRKLQEKKRVYNASLLQLKDQGRILQEVSSGKKLGGIDWVNLEEADNILSPSEYEKLKQFAISTDNPETEQVEGLGWKTTAGADTEWFGKMGGADRGWKIEAQNEKRFEQILDRVNPKFNKFREKFILLGTDDNNESNTEQLTKALEYYGPDGNILTPSEAEAEIILRFVNAGAETDFYSFFEEIESYKLANNKTGETIERILSTAPNIRTQYNYFKAQYEKLKREPAYKQREQNLVLGDEEFAQSVINNINKSENKDDAYLTLEGAMSSLSSKDGTKIMDEIIKQFPGASKEEFINRVQGKYKDVVSDLRSEDPTKSYMINITHSATLL
jgi:hypothetical protein